MNEYIMALIGGGMIGLSASILLMSIGRVAGISGITGSVLQSTTTDKGWRVSFVSGLLGGGLLLQMMYPEVFDISESRSLGLMIVAGLFVGFGTQMGSGCTSGHGVCGLSRFSIRSLVATGAFMVAGMAISTVYTMYLGA